ncbi:tandem-95 repeat protein [Teredinibacter turnerae]|uniref:tandem-95 repeat protein n=1 Tax=Teredinibacter turnerae TaxID=2426 RepID=UPI000365C60A|nr:tandem-95 repeat protein [Teredinibacter turnerae]
MKHFLAQGITSILLPFTAYAATGSYANTYQRNARSQTPQQAALLWSNDKAHSVAAPYSPETLNTNAPVLTHGNPVRELVIIDSAVQDKQTLFNGIAPGVAVAEIVPGEDGVTQLVEILAKYQHLDAVHLFSHGSSGNLQLADRQIPATELREKTELFAALEHAVSPGGDFLLYGCNFAANAEGEDFLDLVSHTTGLDTAASADLTGNTANDGDWDLEIARGDITAQTPFSEQALRDFSGVLAPHTYTSQQLYNDNTPSSYYYQTVISTGDGYFDATNLGGRVSAVDGGGSYGYLYASTGSGLYGKTLQIAADGTNVGTFELNTLQLSVGELGCTALDISVNVTVEGYYPNNTSAGTQNVTVATPTTFCGYGDVDTVDVSSTFGAGKALSRFVVKYQGTAPNNRYFLIASFTVDNLQPPDVTPPTLATVTGVPSVTTDSTPDFTFSTDEAGTLTVGGSCGSSDEGAISSGSNTITLTQTDNSTPLTDALYSDCTVTVQDSFGNSSTPLAINTFRVDSNPPVLSEVTPVASPTNDSTPNVTFSTNEAGTLSVGGLCGTSTSTTISSTGNHTITLTQAGNSSPLADSTYTNCTLTLTDSVGNASSPLALTTFIVDTTAPANPSTPDMQAGSDSGSSNTDNTTADTTPSFTGTSEANATITLSSNVNGTVGSATADGSGNWTITASTLSAGAHQISATATDQATNTSGSSTSLSIVIDTLAPSAPSTADLATASDLGTSSSDNLTSNTTPQFTGTAEANGLLSLQSSLDGSIGSATVDGSGNWTVNASTLSQGAHTITSTVTDLAGNTSAASAGLSVTIDTTAPAVTSVSVPANNTYGLSDTLNFVVNLDDTVVVNTGGGTPRLALTIGAATRYASYASGSGTSSLVFSYSVESGLNDSDGIALNGSLDLNSGTITDSAGNSISTTLASVGSLTSVLVDTLAPSLTEFTAVASATNATTPSVVVSVSEDGTLAFSGSCGSLDAGSVSAGNVSLRLTQPDNSTSLTEGTYSDCAITATDAGGNASPPLSLSSFTVDRTSPTLTEFTAVTTPGNDSSPAFVVAASEVGSLAIGGSCGLGSSPAMSAGNNSVTLLNSSASANLADGTYSDCTAVLTDAAGNASSPLSLSSFTIDTSAPTLAVVTAVPSLGADSTPSLTFSSSEAGTLAVGGSCGSSDIGAISSGNTPITLTATNNSSSLSDGTYADCTLTVTDSAGNSSTPLALAQFTIDTTPPSIAQATAVATPTNDATPDVALLLSEAGILAVNGSCGSAAEGSIGAGSQTITLTQTDNSSALADGTYSDCTVSLTDPAGNSSAPAALSAFQIDTQAPTLTEATAVTTPTADTTPSLTLAVNETSTLQITGSCALGSTSALTTGNNSVTLATLSDATYSDCVAQATDSAGNLSTPVTLSSFTIDSAGPVLAETSAVNTPTSNSSPSMTFTSSEAGVLSITGNCGSPDTGSVASGSATITLTQPDGVTPLADGSYSNCAVTVTDNLGNASTPLLLSSFDVDTAAPVVTESAAVTSPNRDATPTLSITLSEAGSITVGGDCGSSDEGPLASGTHTITLTQPDNINALADGTYSNCTISVSDGAGNLSTQLSLSAFTIDVTAPVLATNAGLTLDEGASATISASLLSATDQTTAAADILISLSSSPTNGNLRRNGVALSAGSSFYQTEITQGNIQYSHDGGESTGDSFSFTLTDALDNTSSPQTFAITVTPQNDAPDTTADTATTNEDTPVTVDVLANDVDPDDTINAASVLIVAAASNGQASVNTANGDITYTPNADFNGVDSFSYTVQDTTGDTSASTLVSITITAVNDAPVAVADAVSTDINTPVTIDVAANDSDIDVGDSLDTASLSVVNAPAHGTAQVVNGSISYTPTTDYLGDDSFTYTIDDTNGLSSNAATVTISVIDPNSSPSAANDSATTNEDTPVTIAVLSNDSDPDGSLVPGSVAIATPPMHGTASVASNGTVNYTPASNYFGSDSFTYTVADDDGAVSAAATVSITVNSVNDAPQANDDTVRLLEDASLTINVLGNDSDVDGTLAPATLVIVTNAASGIAVVDNGQVVYTPLDDYVGSDTFTYTVADNAGTVSNTATVTLTVDPVNDAPKAADDNFTILAASASDLVVLENDADIDGSLDAASITVVAAPAQGTLTNNNDGTLRYTPSAGIAPLDGDSFSYTVLDNDGESSNTATVTLTFVPGSTPVITGTPAEDIIEGQAFSFTPTVTDADSLFTLTFSVQNLPAWMAFDSATGSLSGTPTRDDVGAYDNITLSVSDGVNTSVLSAFSVEVFADVDTDNDTISDYQEQLDGTDPNDPMDYLDLTPPDLLAPSDIIVDATGLFTRVTLAQLLSLDADATQAELDEAVAALVTDNVNGDGCCNAAPQGITDSRYQLRPGVHAIHWTAEDFMGNSSQVTQTVFVRPLVSLSKDQTSVEGATASFQVLLNGPAISYPFEVPLMIDTSSTATETDYEPVPTSVVFNEGQTEVSVAIRTLADTTAENDEVLRVQLDDRTSAAEDLSDGFDADIYDINAGAKTTFALTIVERNVPPKLTLTLRQAGKQTIQVTPNGGDVTVTSAVVDPNPNDTHSIDWSGTDSLLNDTSATPTVLTFSPADLASGRYKVKAKATDSANGSNTAVLHFVVVQSLPQLLATDDTDNDGIDDETEGTADSDDDGIADYLDNITATNVLPERARQTDSFLIECDPGVRCRLGEFSIQTPSSGARLLEDERSALNDFNEDTHFNSSGIFDFELADLPEAGRSTSVVIPQIAPIPANALYRKFQNGEWRTFIEDANNLLHSTAGTEGFCPPPGDSAWQPGLTEGHWCVQLTIEDGGPNDADGEVNGSVSDPGAVATQKRRTIKTGGGAASGVLMLLIALLAIGRRAQVSRKLPLAALLAGGLTGTAPAPAQAYEPETFFVSATALTSESQQSAGDYASTMTANGVETTVLNYDAKSNGYHINLGHTFTPFVSSMFGYLDLGKADTELSFLDEDDAIVSKALEESYPHLGKGVTTNARFHYDLHSAFTIYADAGLYYWRSKIHVGQSDIEAEQKGLDPWGGLGIQLNYQAVSVNVSYQYFKLDETSATTLGIGLGYQF